MDVLTALKQQLGARLTDMRAAILAAGRAYNATDPAGHKRIVLHHSAGPRSQTVEQIDAFHRAPEPNGRGWPGIGYHFVVRHGHVHWVGDLATERAHTWGRNADSIGICITGSYDEGRPADEDVTAVRLLVAGLDKAFGKQLELVGHGAASLPGHGTACPGRNLVAVLGGLRTTDTAGAALAIAALQSAERAHVLPINPASALCRAILGSNMVPTSPEHDLMHEGKKYLVMRGESMVTGKVAAFYVREGDWANVRRVDRP